MELLQNVLIKEVDGTKTGDKVFIVDNLPKSLIYARVAKQMIDYTNPQQNLVPAFEIDERGRKIPTGETIDELLPGIEHSQSGDNSFVFFIGFNESRYRLEAIDRYIQQAAPVADRVPRRVPYATQPGVLTSGPRPLSDIPRVVLPGLVSPPAQAVQVAGTPQSDTVSVAPARKTRVWTDEQKKAAADRLALARAAKKEKATNS